jgi:hypothetical protein
MKRATELFKREVTSARNALINFIYTKEPAAFVKEAK